MDFKTVVAAWRYATKTAEPSFEQFVEVLGWEPPRDAEADRAALEALRAGQFSTTDELIAALAERVSETKG